jgi:3-methyladenine DNA glycosylase/8-oxoguanine DNA glycosylase
VQLPPFGVDPHDGTLTRIELLRSGRVIELFISEAAGGASVETHERISITGAEREEIARKVWWMLNLGQSFAPFYTLTREEPGLNHVEEQALGRILRSPTVFEDTVKTILTTNTTWAGTIRMVEALVSTYGPPLPTDPSRHAFPTAGQLATAEERELRELGLGYRAPYVLTLARDTASGRLDLEALKEDRLPTSEVHHRLLGIRGVGEYAAANLLMLLGRYNFVPVDSWARNVVSREWYGGQPIGDGEVKAAFERWGPWKGLAYWFWNWSS